RYEPDPLRELLLLALPRDDDVVVVLPVLAGVVAQLDAVVDAQVVEQLRHADRELRGDGPEHDVAALPLRPDADAAVGLEHRPQVRRNNRVPTAHDGPWDLHFEPTVEQSVPLHERP